jgi:hypothetical protein
MDKNSVKYLQGTNFLQLILAEKTEIKNLHSATPDLVLSDERNALLGCLLIT